jgi:hypothetical protein
MQHLLEHVDTRRVGIALAAGLVAAALAAAIAIPASSPTLLERARDAAPTVDAAP